MFPREAFQYVKERNEYRCPAGGAPDLALQERRKRPDPTLLLELGLSDVA